MTNELEKTFYDTFGIEPKCVKRTLKLAIHGYDENNLPEDLRQFMSSQAQVYHVYPQITDRILLELICIHNQYSHPFSIYGEKKEFLKNDILECMINILNYFYEHEMEEYSKLKQQVRTLFEE